MTQSKLVTYKEAAEILHVKEKWVRDQACHGKFTQIRLGPKTIRLYRAEVEKLIKDSESKSWA